MAHQQSVYCAMQCKAMPVSWCLANCKDASASACKGDSTSTRATAYKRWDATHLISLVVIVALSCQLALKLFQQRLGLLRVYSALQWLTAIRPAHLTWYFVRMIPQEVAAYNGSSFFYNIIDLFSLFLRSWCYFLFCEVTQNKVNNKNAQPPPT